MPLDITDFRSMMAQDGARPNLFEVELNIPTSVQNLSPGFNRKFITMCRAAAIPGQALGTTPVAYQGRDVKLAGNRTFETWTVTVYNDEDFSMRKAFEAWNNSINTHRSNLRLQGIGGSGGSPSYDYTSDAIVHQLSKFDGSPNRSYRMLAAWPALVEQIPLDWGDNDRVMDFTVTFEMDLWETADLVS